MQKKKDNFLEKVIKKNYNNELEHILEHKDFDENTKSILLSIFYKLETAYGDYEQVKGKVMNKDEYLQLIINIIMKSVDKINIVNMDSNNNIEVDKKNKEITSYPIEQKILYSLAKISKKDKIIKDKYYVINRTLSDLINTGNNIGMVEPLRDFNGFSWAIVAKDIESLEYNLIYKNLEILVGTEFLNNWIYNRESIIDYYSLFENKLEEIYGKDIKDELIEIISKLSVLLEVKYNYEKARKFQNSKKQIEEKLEEISNKEELTIKLTKEKKELNKKIKAIDTIISDKNLLKQEYIRRNEQLPLDKKIFSMRVLAKIMIEERQEIENKRENINKLLNPKMFVKYKNELEEKYKYIKYLEVTNIEENILAELLNLQKIFIEGFKIKIEKANSKEEILQLILELRYYLNLPFNLEYKIKNINHFRSDLEMIKKYLIKKALEGKVLQSFSDDLGFNYAIFKELFETQIINLTQIEVKLEKDNDILSFEIYDEEIFDRKIGLCNLDKIDLKIINVKFGKKYKIFN